MRGRYPQRNRSARRRWLFLGVLGCLIAIAFLPRLLATSAIKPAKAQAIYVFPGRLPERAECAAQLYRDGVAPLVVFTGAQRNPKVTAALGSPMSDAELNARVANRLGVPRSAEIVVDEGTSTWEDVLALGDWMTRTDTRRVVAITSATHSRRAWSSIQFALGDDADAIEVYRCGAPYGPLWWTRESSLVGITEELLKLGFYSIRYFLPAALGASPGRPVGGPPIE